MIPRALPFRAVFSTLPSIQKESIDHFRGDYFQPERPVAFRQPQFKSTTLALQKWFLPLDSQSKSCACALNQEYFDSQPDVPVPLERTTTESDQRGDVKCTFERLTAPLSLFRAWTASKLANPSTFEPNASLYLAQCDLASLPPLLSLDLGPPALVSKSGRGDVYASSLWMGIAPTNTPLHKDPNPNLLLQLAGTKVVRMVSPEVGRAVYQETRKVCVEAEGGTLGAGTMRGEEMMVGLEREILDTFIWTDKQKSSPETGKVDGYETTLAAGEAVFIPKGWWHSVRGVGTAMDGVNASVIYYARNIAMCFADNCR